jgi:hypothetical protein
MNLIDPFHLCIWLWGKIDLDSNTFSRLNNLGNFLFKAWTKIKSLMSNNVTEKPMILKNMRNKYCCHLFFKALSYWFIEQYEHSHKQIFHDQNKLK